MNDIKCGNKQVELLKVFQIYDNDTFDYIESLKIIVYAAYKELVYQVVTNRFSHVILLECDKTDYRGDHNNFITLSLFSIDELQDHVKQEHIQTGYRYFLSVEFESGLEIATYYCPKELVDLIIKLNYKIKY